jgi:uncharacterized damage-inducible protein DinB
MMTPEQIHQLFQYNQWANRRTLDACGALTNEQLTRDLGSSFKSVRDTLAHIFGAEWIWRERLLGRATSGLPAPSEFPDLASLRAKLEDMDREYVEYTSKLTPAETSRLCVHKNLAGMQSSTLVWQILQHLGNHNSYHRGQVVTLMRQLGAKPVSTGMIEFYREQASGAHA